MIRRPPRSTLDRSSAASDVYKRQVSNKLVTFLGRVTYQKGPEYFVEAAQKTLDVFPDSHFVMAGSGDALPRIIHSVAEKRLSSHFHFTGFLKKHDIDQLLACTSVY